MQMIAYVAFFPKDQVTPQPNAPNVARANDAWRSVDGRELGELFAAWEASSTTAWAAGCWNEANVVVAVLAPFVAMPFATSSFLRRDVDDMLCHTPEPLPEPLPEPYPSARNMARNLMRCDGHRILSILSQNTQARTPA